MEDDRVADLNNEDVLLAARYGDLDDLKQWLDGSQPQLDVNAVDANDSTAVHLAAANGHADVVSFLLTRTRQELINAQNKGGNTALHWAALNGHLATVKVLLEFGALPQIKNNSNKTPLDEGMQNNHDEVCVAIVQSSKYKADEDDSIPELPPNTKIIEDEEDDDEMDASDSVAGSSSSSS